jgi:hypothetical protein
MFLSRAVDVLEPLHLGLPPVGLLPVALLSNARTSALGNHLINRPQWRQLARSACGPVPGLSTGVLQVPQWGQGRVMAVPSAWWAGEYVRPHTASESPQP